MSLKIFRYAFSPAAEIDVDLMLEMGEATRARRVA